MYHIILYLLNIYYSLLYYGIFIKNYSILIRRPLLEISNLIYFSIRLFFYRALVLALDLASPLRQLPQACPMLPSRLPHVTEPGRWPPVPHGGGRVVGNAQIECYSHVFVCIQRLFLPHFICFLAQAAPHDANLLSN